MWDLEDLIEGIELGETSTLKLEMMRFLKLGIKVNLGGSIW